MAESNLAERAAVPDPLRQRLLFGCDGGSTLETGLADGSADAFFDVVICQAVGDHGKRGVDGCGIGIEVVGFVGIRREDIRLGQK